jgi:hypothetical protein
MDGNIEPKLPEAAPRLNCSNLGKLDALSACAMRIVDPSRTSMRGNLST